MNRDETLGNWKQMTGKFKEKWGKFTDDELTQAEGRIEYLSGIIQERYGQTKENALHQINDFFKSFDKKETNATKLEAK